MFLTKRFYIVSLGIILLFIGGYLLDSLFMIGQIALISFLFLILIDTWMLYKNKAVTAERSCSARFSNGDENKIRIRIENRYSFEIKVNIIDEIPYVFQNRHVNFRTTLKAREGKTIEYKLRPTRRGEYGFGLIRVFVTNNIGLISRRYTCAKAENIKVYPSYLMLHRYELMAMSNNLVEMGIKKYAG